MSQERLFILALMSVEDESTGDIEVDASMQQFATEKSSSRHLGLERPTLLLKLTCLGN